MLFSIALCISTLLSPVWSETQDRTITTQDETVIQAQTAPIETPVEPQVQDGAMISSSVETATEQPSATPFYHRLSVLIGPAFGNTTVEGGLGGSIQLLLHDNFSLGLGYQKQKLNSIGSFNHSSGSLISHEAELQGIPLYFHVQTPSFFTIKTRVYGRLGTIFYTIDNNDSELESVVNENAQFTYRGNSLFSNYKQKINPGNFFLQLGTTSSITSHLKWHLGIQWQYLKTKRSWTYYNQSQSKTHDLSHFSFLTSIELHF